MSDTLRNKLIQKGWVTEFHADTLVALIEKHYAALAEPEPEVPGPTDEELKAVARLGNHQGILDSSPQPIPVSERLPGPGDCDAEGRCWVWWKNGVRWVLDDWTPVDFRSEILCDAVSHWLPAHALPLPSGEVSNV